MHEMYVYLKPLYGGRKYKLNECSSWTQPSSSNFKFYYYYYICESWWCRADYNHSCHRTVEYLFLTYLRYWKKKIRKTMRWIGHVWYNDETGGLLDKKTHVYFSLNASSHPVTSPHGIHRRIIWNFAWTARATITRWGDVHSDRGYYVTSVN